MVVQLENKGMLTIYLLQSLVPLALVVWLAIAPLQSAIGFWTQAFVTAIGIAAIGLTGLWLFPPYWVPWTLGVLLAAVIAARCRRRQQISRWPDAAWGWVGLIAFSTLGLYAGNQVRLALSGMRPPEGLVVDLASPLGPGTYLVANGGAALVINAHNEVLDASIPRHRRWRGEAYGLDLVAIDRWGLRTNGLMPSNPSWYRIFGTPVVAPCTGVVIASVDGLPDMRVSEVDPVNLAGNHVFLRCAAADIVLGHLRNGSLRVHVGQLVATGAPIAQVGNSGNTGEPHLHIHAQTSGTTVAPFSGTPIPLKIKGRFLVRNDRFAVIELSQQP